MLCLFTSRLYLDTTDSTWPTENTNNIARFWSKLTNSPDKISVLGSLDSIFLGNKQLPIQAEML